MYHLIYFVTAKDIMATPKIFKLLKCNIYPQLYLLLLKQFIHFSHLPLLNHIRSNWSFVGLFFFFPKSLVVPNTWIKNKLNPRDHKKSLYELHLSTELIKEWNRNRNGNTLYNITIREVSSTINVQGASAPTLEFNCRISFKEPANFH